MSSGTWPPGSGGHTDWSDVKLAKLFSVLARIGRDTDLAGYLNQLSDADLVRVSGVAYRIHALADDQITLRVARRDDTSAGGDL